MFSNTVPLEQRDPRLKAMLKDPNTGGRAVLAWAVRGAIMFNQRGRLPRPDAVVLAVQSYQDNNDMFTHFINECFTRSGDAQISVREAYSAYLAWATNTNERPVRRPQFLQRMKDRGYTASIADTFIGLTPKNISMSNSGAITWS
jgi:phage/plasmid-associated DNA primase